NLSRPIAKCLVRVVILIGATRSMRANIDKRRSNFPGCRRIMMIRKAERNLAPAQQVEDRWFIPAGMTKFECVATAHFQQSQKTGQAIAVGDELWRQLEQDRPDFWPKNAQSRFEQCEAVTRFIGEAFPVRNEF